jgi:hypothetical protein
MSFMNMQNLYKAFFRKTLKTLYQIDGDGNSGKVCSYPDKSNIPISRKIIFCADSEINNNKC